MRPESQYDVHGVWRQAALAKKLGGEQGSTIVPQNPHIPVATHSEPSSIGDGVLLPSLANWTPLQCTEPRAVQSSCPEVERSFHARRARLHSVQDAPKHSVWAYKIQEHIDSIKGSG